MKPGNHNLPPVLDQFQAPQINFDQLPPMNVHPNLDVVVPDDISSMTEAPSVFQRQAAPADRFAGVNAAARGNVVADLPMPVSAQAARRTLEKAGISSDVASKWRETAQAQWEDQNGRDPKSMRIKAAMAAHHENTMRMIIDGKFDDSETEDKE